MSNVSELRTKGMHLININIAKILGLTKVVMGSEQVGTRFDIIPKPLDQEIQTGQPDLFKGQSGFKHKIDST